MSKYKVGDELIQIENPNAEKEYLRDMTGLSVSDDIAKISWGLKIVDVIYENPYVTLVYRNIDGRTNKVFAECKDSDNFDKEMVLEKALLKAFQNEIISITVSKNCGLK